MVIYSESRRKFHKLRLVALSVPLLIPHFVIKKERPRGARHGKTETQKEHCVAHNARKRCIKRNYEGIHDRFLRDLVVIRNSKLAGPRTSASQKINWHGQECADATSIKLSKSQSRTVSMESQAKNVQNPFLPNRIGDGTPLPQTIPGGSGTRPKVGGAHEKSIHFLKCLLQ